MNQVVEQDYVLGTNDEEVERLALQHAVWRPTALHCWQRAGITTGSRVLDVGAGPGYASADLASIVGPGGQVVAVERSKRFASSARQLRDSTGLTSIEIIEADLMDADLPRDHFDFVWCRWVASFVESPKILIEFLSSVLRRNGVAIFHEYFDYSTWRFTPPREKIELFVDLIKSSWRKQCGEPDIARVLPGILVDAGYRIRIAEPRIFCTGPADFRWQWPARFLEVNSKRLLELCEVEPTFVEEMLGELREAESDPATLMMTPMVLEIVADK